MEITSFPLDYSFIILFTCGYRNPKARKRGVPRNLFTENGGKISTRLFWASLAPTLLRFYSSLKQSEFIGLAVVTASRAVQALAPPVLALLMLLWAQPWADLVWWPAEKLSSFWPAQRTVLPHHVIMKVSMLLWRTCRGWQDDDLWLNNLKIPWNSILSY